MFKKKGVLFLREEYGEGFGKYTYLDREKYEGDWRNGKYHGQGTYTSKDGEKYVGEWKDDKEWNGNEYNKDGKIISKYVDGKEIKLYPPLKPTNNL
jgi:hypothetical protein